MLIPKEWLPKVEMLRVICHWSAGAYQPNSVDKEHYHILIDDDGNLTRGNFSIASNVVVRNKLVIRNGQKVKIPNYAAHTGGANTKSIGVAVCCMHQAMEAGDMGKCPLTEKQWDTLCQVVAELCAAYNIPVLPSTVLGHGEVHATLGTSGNSTKWDTMVLLFRRDLSKKQVGELLRKTVEKHLGSPALPKERLPPATVIIRDKKFTDAFIDDGSVFVKARPVAEAFGFDIKPGVGETVIVTKDGNSQTIPALQRGNSRYVAVRKIAEAFGLAISWDEETRTATIK